MYIIKKTTYLAIVCNISKSEDSTGMRIDNIYLALEVDETNEYAQGLN